MKKLVYLLPFLTVMIISGCVSAPTKTLPPLRIQTATKEALITKINNSAENFHSLKSNLEIRYRDSSTQGARECQGLLAYENPKKIYLKGYRPLIPTFFTLVSRDGNFWVHLPRDNVVLTGQVNQLDSSQNLQMGIRPDDLLRALNIQAIPPSTTHSVEMQETPTHYLLFIFRTDGIDKFLERQIWIERYFLNVEREVFYNQYGIVDVDITKKDYMNKGPVYMPREIIIFRPDRGSTLFLKSEKLEVNANLKPELFKFQTPPGATVEPLVKE